jgi:hypothetical protein
MVGKVEFTIRGGPKGTRPTGGKPTRGPRTKGRRKANRKGSKAFGSQGQQSLDAVDNGSEGQGA